MMNEKGSTMPPQNERNERTPLLQRVPVDERDRVGYPHTTVSSASMQWAARWWLMGV